MQEVNNVNHGLSHVKDRLGYVEARLDQMDGRSYNKLRFLPWHDLARIGVYRLGTGFETPEYFSENIREFWTLQFPRNGTYLTSTDTWPRSLMSWIESHLLYLVRFYDIYDHVHWGEANLDLVDILDAADTSNEESSSVSKLFDPSRRELKVEDAVRKYPQRAVEELASRLGIVIEKDPEFLHTGSRTSRATP